MVLNFLRSLSFYNGGERVWRHKSSLTTQTNWNFPERYYNNLHFFCQIAVNRGAQLTMFVWVTELLLDMARSGIGKHYKCRIGYILDAILEKANNTKKKLILKTLSQSF